MNAGLSPSPSLSISRESAASIQEELSGQPRKHHNNKYLNFDPSIAILPPPPSPLSYTLFDLSESSDDGSEDEENPPAVSRSVRRKLAAETELERSEQRHRAEQKEREERAERRQKRELLLQPLRERYEQWKEDHAREQEQLRIVRERDERFDQRWRSVLEASQQRLERESQAQDETRLRDCSVPITESKKRRVMNFFWKGFGKKKKTKKDKKKEHHQVEEEQAGPSVWVDEDGELPTPKPKRRKNMGIVWKGFGKNKNKKDKKKDKKKERHQLEEEQVLSVCVAEDGQLPTKKAEPTPKDERSQKKVEIGWRGFGKKKNKKRESEKNKQRDRSEAEEEAGPSVRAEAEMEESLPMQAQQPKKTKTKKKRGLFSKLLGDKKNKERERHMEQEHPREEATGLFVGVEEAKPLPSDVAEPTPRAKKSKKNKPGLFSKILGKKKKGRRDYQEQVEETAVSGGAEGAAYGHQAAAPERDLGMDETDQETHSSMPRGHRASSFINIL